LETGQQDAILPHKLGRLIPLTHLTFASDFNMLSNIGTLL
jgi:hypothetical protein